MLIAAGALLVLLGLVLLVVDRFPGLRIGRLPGDIKIQRDNFTFYFPLATSVAVSVVLTLVLWLLRRR